MLLSLLKHRAAAHSGHIEIAYLLLSSGACPNAAMSETGVTAIMLAAQTGNLEMVQLLSVFGADRDATTTDGCFHSALSLALSLDTDDPHSDHCVALWLEFVAGWCAIQISVGCRLLDEARTALAVRPASLDNIYGPFLTHFQLNAAPHAPRGKPFFSSSFLPYMVPMRMGVAC